ncbi:MAG: BspA family leucine-rich repeat surface protein [Clostridia bacterium]|nr:BspA family leucine-rich repeat surface protein [Clostridia bacterium]
MWRMFQDCSSLTSIDLSSFNTQNGRNMDYMFLNCSALKTIIANSFNTSHLQSSIQMFYTCLELVGGNGTTYSSSHTNAEYARVDGENGLPGYFTAPEP